MVAAAGTGGVAGPAATAVTGAREGPRPNGDRLDGAGPCDAVVIGAGPNGLVAANVLADAGWDVVVLEAQPTPGGAVRTAEITAPGFRNDLFSAFYPLAAASPVIARLGLADHGLRWVRAPQVLAHPTPGGPSAVLSTDLDVTAASLDAFAPGDGDAWRRLFGFWEQGRRPLVDALFTPIPPVAPGARLAATLGGAGMRRLVRLALLSVRRLADEEFRGEGGGLLLAGNALHADLTPETAGSALFGWLLVSLGQEVGFPVPEGGAQALTDALVARLRARGGRVVCNAPVERVVVAEGRARGVRIAGGAVVDGRRAVLADTAAPHLFRDLVGEELLPASFRDALDRYDPGVGTVKVDWALDGPIPWSDPAVRPAGTVHLADSIDALSRYAFELATSQLPSDPFLVLGQMTTADPTRSPAGTESAWAYTHVPQHVRADARYELSGTWGADDAEGFAARMEEQVEQHAPGFRARIVARHVFTPPALQAADANLEGGAVNGGTAQLHQQAIFRPVPGLGRPETPIPGLFLASAAAHPGGGVHGACGSNAARAALAAERRRRLAWVIPAAAGAVGLARLARQVRERST